MSPSLPPLLSFPMEGSADGALRFSRGHDSVREAIWNLLLTRPGDRLMRPELGIGLRRFVHQPNNETTRSLMQDTILRGLRRWEPRIQLDHVRVEADPERHDGVHIHIHYRLRSDGTEDSLNLAFRLGS